MMRVACLAVMALSAFAVNPPLPYVDTQQDNLMAMAGDVHIMAGSNSIKMEDAGLTFTVGSTSATLDSLKQNVMDAGVSRAATNDNANSDVPLANSQFNSAIVTLGNSLDREQLDLNTIASGLDNTYTAVSNEASTLLAEMNDFDAVATGSNLDSLSNNVASFSTDAQAMVNSLDAMVTDKKSSLETAANAISNQFSTSAASVETAMQSIESAVRVLPATEASTISTLTRTATNYARTSINTINTAERTRATASDNTLNTFVAARTNAQTQLDTLDSIETAVTTGFNGRYTNIMATTRNLLEGKYGGDTEIDATPSIVKNITYAYYGRACAASGAYFACSAYRYKSGMVAVYKMDTATEKVKLLQIIQPKMTYIYSYFGNSMDMDGDLLVVGSYQARPTTTAYGRGQVFVYKRDSSDQYQALANVTQATANYDYCGYSVAVSAGRFAFACSGQNTKVGTATRTDAGVVYVYTVSATGAIAYQANMSHTVGVAAYDRLGGAFDAMSMFGNTLVVGMTGYESSTKYSEGGAAIFEYASNKWSEKAVVTAPPESAAAYDYFGTCVVAGNGIIAISSPYGDGNSSTGSIVYSTGTIYIYKKNSTGFWNVDQTLTAEGSLAYDYLGFAMDINSDGTQLIASAHGDDGAASGAGAVHQFSRSANGKFSLQKTIFHKDAASGDGFGYGASYGKGYYVAGAWQAEDETRYYGHGKAYAFISAELFPSA